MDSVKPDLVPETKFYAQITTALYLLVVITIGTASYMLNGPEFSAWYGSDQAIQVLMANDFSWPRDLYYWRQNRLGSIVPFFATVFICLE
jgi:hypothetical protein